jgi:hypothetical protein
MSNGDWWLNIFPGYPIAKALVTTFETTVAAPEKKAWDDVLTKLKEDAALIGIAGVTALAFGLAALSRRNGA